MSPKVKILIGLSGSLLYQRSTLCVGFNGAGHIKTGILPNGDKLFGQLNLLLALDALEDSVFGGIEMKSIILSVLKPLLSIKRK